jgi:TolA-binding protein
MEERPSMPAPVTDPGFSMSDSDLFWQEHWKKFAGGLVAVAALILLAGLWSLWTAHVRQSAEALFSEATSPEGWRAVVERFPGSVPAGNARVRLADALRAEGNLAGAAAELESLLSSQPDYPLAGPVWLTLGELRQSQGDRDGALEAYRTSSTRHKASYAAPLALIAEANLLKTDSVGEARAVLQSVGSLYPGTPAAMVAEGELRQLGSAPGPGAQPVP